MFDPLNCIPEMVEPGIPIVDLSPFLIDDEDDNNNGKHKAMATITKACSEYGFFQIVNHGVSLDLMRRALEVSKLFFDYSDEEKKKSSPSSNAPLPAGYNRDPPQSLDKKEYVLVFPPGSSFNVYPQNPPQFREVVQEMFAQLSKTGLVFESIISECLGLSPTFLKEYRNDDRSWDFMAALHYFPASKNDTNGITEHEDGNLITFVVQDGVGGLQVCKNGEWIPVVPAEGTIVVNIGDVIQVLSNKKFKSATHRVVRREGHSRYSYAFFHNLIGDKWVEPLPQFTIEKGEPPKYRGFVFKEYQQLRVRNKTHPPSRPEDMIHIDHYEIDA